MSAKNIKRVIYAVLAVLAFAWAWQQYGQVGWTPPTVLTGGFGVLLGYMAATGAG